MATGSEADWETLQRQLSQAGQRRLVLVEGDRTQCLRWLRRQCLAIAGETRLWVGDRQDVPAAGWSVVSPVQARQWLGRETHVLVWDGWAGNPPDSLAALSGTLCAGGLWFWLVPPLAHWPGFADPDYGRTGLADATDHPFARRLAAILAADTSVIRVHPGLNPEPILPNLPVPARPFEVGATAEQRQLVDDIVKAGQGRRRRPLVVTADRGRGKSAALGMAAVRLLQSGRGHIAVTAPSIDAVRTLLRHAREAAGNELLPGQGEHEVMLTDGRSLRFYALDDLLVHQPDAELVIVDEAAAIPASQLRAVLLGWPRCVFASTIHGYEGAGRGFSIRFRDVLQRETPHWRQVSVAAPIRWASDDPLERLTAALFLLNASAPEGAPAGTALTVARWHPDQASERELSAAFGLLVDAHYRTTPADLRQWMDDPAAVSWRVCCGQDVVAVLWATVEGGLDETLAQAVMTGKRRVRGHLLPQSLASHSGFAEAATLRLLRVVRVAVSDQYRRQGLGQQLVAQALAYARAQALDGVGTSYGASADLLAFWQRCDWPLVRLGLHREASSGEYTVQRLVGVSAAGSDLQVRLARRFADHWPILLPVTWRQLAPPQVLAVNEQVPSAAGLSQQDWRELMAFADGHRGFELSLPVLRQFSRLSAVIGLLPGMPEANLWSRAVMQGHSWAELQSQGHCMGRRDGETRLRSQVLELLEKTSELVNRSI